MMWDGTNMWGGGLFGIGVMEALLLVFFGLMIVAGIALLVVWVSRPGRARSTEGSQTASAGTDPAVVIARERFARGEIAKEELDEIVRALGG